MTSTNPFMTWTATSTLQQPAQPTLEETVAKEVPKRRVGLVGSMVIGAQIALQTVLGFASPAQAQEYRPSPVMEQLVAAQTPAIPFRYATAGTANAPGMSGSFWKTVVRGENLGSSTATVVMLAHPRGQGASPSDPTFVTTLAPGQTFDYTNMLETMNFTGAALLEVQSDQPLGLNDSITGNLSSSNGSFQGGNMPFFDMNNLSADPRITQAGDIREIRLGDPTTRRSNLLDANFSANPVKDIVYMIENGTVVDQKTIDVPPLGYVQVSPIYSIFPGVAPKNGQTVRILTTAADPNTSVATVAYISEIDNVTSVSQDPALLAGYVRPLITSSRVQTSPEQAEVNDQLYHEASITTRDGTTIDRMLVGDETGFGWTVPGNGANTTTFKLAFNAGTAGIHTLRARAMVGDGTGNGYVRDVSARPNTIVDEKDGYVATKEDVKAYVLANLKEASLLVSRGTLGGVMYTGTQWETMWPAYFDGQSGVGNPELKRLVINDKGNGLGTGGNSAVLELEDGTKQAIMSIPESYLDRLRTMTKAVQPQ